MKKKFLIALSIVLLTSTCNLAYSKVNVSSDLASAIKLYKSGNYTESYVRLDSVIKKDPSNALAYYYKAMAATQVGKREEAIENYDKALTFAPAKSNLQRYAVKGKRCVETPERCSESEFSDALDEFIRSKSSGMYSDEVRGQYEELKIKNLKRNINKDGVMIQDDFKDYRDFSSMNFENSVPSNDDIVAAIKTLQKAGLYNNGISDVSMLTNMGIGGNNPLLNLTGSSNLNSQLIQTMLTNNMSLGF